MTQRTATTALLSALFVTLFLVLSPSALAATGAVAMVRVGNVDEHLLNRITTFIDEEFSVPIRVLPPVAKPAPSLEEQAAVLTKESSAAGNDLIFAMVAAPEAVKHQGGVFPQLRIAMVNTTALRSGMTTPSANEEAYECRVEKESVRAIALLVGLPQCPFPRCALFPHSSDAELDAKSRNLCPPCGEKAGKALRVTLGIKEPEPPPSGPIDEPARPEK